MQQNKILEIKYFNQQTLDYILQNNLSFSFNILSTDSNIKNFKEGIKYLASKNFDFKSKQIIINLDIRDKYLNRKQIDELKKCDSIITIEGGRLAINDENKDLWTIDNIILANNRIDNAVETINSLRVPDEDNRLLNNLEKLMMAYEICRSLSYNENVDDNMHARTITAILNDGRDIVCVGYASLFQELCTRLNIKCYKHYCTVNDNNNEGQQGKHVNNIVVVNKKIFYNDICWDSVKSGDALGKYGFFMLPYADKTQIKNKVHTINEFDQVASPFVNILKDKKDLHLASLIPDSESMSNQLKEQLSAIRLKYSGEIKGLDYFDETSTDLEIKQGCKQLLEKLGEYQIDYSIPIEVLEKSLYNLNRACGAIKPVAEMTAKNTIDYNTARATELFEQDAINSFIQANQVKQEIEHLN